MYMTKSDREKGKDNEVGRWDTRSNIKNKAMSGFDKGVCLVRVQPQ